MGFGITPGRCFFCGKDNPQKTHPHLFLDNKGIEIEIEVPYCGECEL